MKKRRVNKGIKKIINNIKMLVVASATLTSLLYICYIVFVSLCCYLYNRPYRLVALSIAITIIFFVLDAKQQRQAQRQAKHKQRQLKAKAMATIEQNKASI